ncbi:MAG: phosphatidylserine/phosphatidylglycerophosphate/cardiolipin synthase family protein [Elusimicrobia bacterium]|nr:phosphatidylserine/phosphatidylglycerophosphate/cardiolipin synthase family protein [Elusimicrobiota bacterium]
MPVNPVAVLALLISFAGPASAFDPALSRELFLEKAAGQRVPPPSPAAKSDPCAFEDELKKAFNDYKLALVHKGPADKKTKALLKSYRELLVKFGASEKGCPNRGPAYLYEELEEGNGDSSLLGGFWGKLKAAYEGRAVPGRDDMALNFMETSANSLKALAGREEFWPALIKDIQGARSSVVVHIFGLQADEWGWEVAMLLGQKARDGVKVHVLADRSGARMTALHKHASAEIFKFWDQVGVKYAFYDSSMNPFNQDKFLHFDHRKYFIIDGKVSYTTGYTLEQHMRKEMFDLAVRAEGPVVGQMQASFFLNYFANGGAAREGNFDAFSRRYFPEPGSAGGMKARVALNIPWRQHRVTESYFSRISGARKSVHVINPYFTDDKIVAALLKAAANGAEVKVVLPLKPENALNSGNSLYHAYDLHKRGVKVFLYRGPEKFGRLHGKGLLVDDSFVSIGSCNMDAMALYRNFEQNIESTDAAFAAQARRDVFERAVADSVPYTASNPVTTYVNGYITEPFDFID